MKKPKHLIGTVVLSMEGLVMGGKWTPNYYTVCETYNAWVQNKLYYATRIKKDNRINLLVIDMWLTRGYQLEVELNKLLTSLKHTARH